MVTAKWDYRTKLMTMGEACNYLHVNENVLNRWCDHGLIPAFRVGIRGDRWFLKTDVDKLKKNILR